MSLTLNMVGGGGGGGLSATDAILRVQAPAGSTVTITKGSTTKSDQGHENADDNSVYDYYFIIHQSQFDATTPWTVTATLGAKSSTSTIIINASDEFDVVLTYELYLFESGIGEVTPLTTTLDTNARLTVTEEKINTTWTSSSAGSNARVSICTTDPVNVTNYSILHIRLNLTAKYNYGPAFGIAENAIIRTSTLTDFAASSGTLSVTSGEVTLTLDISSYTGNYYVAYWGTSKCDIFDFWLT